MIVGHIIPLGILERLINREDLKNARKQREITEEFFRYMKAVYFLGIWYLIYFIGGEVELATSEHPFLIFFMVVIIYIPFNILINRSKNKQFEKDVEKNVSVQMKMGASFYDLKEYKKAIFDKNTGQVVEMSQARHENGFRVDGDYDQVKEIIKEEFRRDKIDRNEDITEIIIRDESQNKSNENVVKVKKIK